MQRVVLLARPRVSSRSVFSGLFANTIFGVIGAQKRKRDDSDEDEDESEEEKIPAKTSRKAPARKPKKANSDSEVDDSLDDEEDVDALKAEAKGFLKKAVR